MGAELGPRALLSGAGPSWPPVCAALQGVGLVPGTPPAARQVPGRRCPFLGVSLRCSHWLCPVLLLLLPHLSFFFFLIMLCSYFWLCFIFMPCVRGLFLQLWPAGATLVVVCGLLVAVASPWRSRALGRPGFSRCGSRALERRLSSSGARA